MKIRLTLVLLLMVAGCSTGQLTGDQEELLHTFPRASATPVSGRQPAEASYRSWKASWLGSTAIPKVGRIR